jgi:hypothetical protein
MEPVSIGLWSYINEKCRVSSDEGRVAKKQECRVRSVEGKNKVPSVVCRGSSVSLDTQSSTLSLCHMSCFAIVAISEFTTEVLIVSK